MQKSGSKTGGDYAIFSVLEVKILKIFRKFNKRNCFVYILGFIFYDVSHAKAHLHNKYMI